MNDPEKGKWVHNHLLLEKLGEGGYGEVWKSEYFGQAVALKVFTRAERLGNLRNEVVAQYQLGRLESDEGRYFPRVEHIDFEANPPYMRMELIEGSSLEEYLRENPQLAVADRLDLSRRILEGLAVVHKHGFVHGDLSPGNIMVGPKGEVKIIDVGFGAVFTPADGVERSGDAAEVLGAASPSYAAPERGQCALRECGKQCDIFSFGKILFHILTGRTPHTIVPPSKDHPDLSAEWDDFIFKCVEHQPEKRFPEAQAALATFAAIGRPGDEVPNSFVAECPNCKTSTLVPEQWLGREFDCRGCRTRLEILFFDVAGGRAEVRATGDESTFTVSAPTMISCPECGAPIDEGTTCEDCPAARRAPSRATGSTAAPEAEVEDFTLRAIIAFLLFGLFWLPGAVATGLYLIEARGIHRNTGKTPPGTELLETMMWVFVYLPLAVVALVLVISLLAAI